MPVCPIFVLLHWYKFKRTVLREIRLLTQFERNKIFLAHMYTHCNIPSVYK